METAKYLINIDPNGDDNYHAWIKHNAEIERIYKLIGKCLTEQVDWNEEDTTSKSFVKNKPNLNPLVKTYNSVEDMKSDMLVLSNMTLQTKGYYSVNDGGAGTYVVRDKKDSDIDDGGSIIFIQNNLIAELIADEVNVLQFGAKGNGENDDTTSIQNALNASHNIYIPTGTYLVSLVTGTSTALTVPSNRCIRMEQDTVLQLKTTNVYSYSILLLKNVENVQITGGRVLGDRDTNTSTTGEWGNAIDLLTAKNVYITGVYCGSCWGDGIYVGSIDDILPSENIHITECTCDNNRRQGISVTCVDGLCIRDTVLKNTNGTKPSAGIDFEPNNSNNVSLKNITLANIIGENNAGGTFLFTFSNKNNKAVNISISHAKCYEDKEPSIITYIDSLLPSSIIFDDIRIYNSRRGCINISNKTALCDFKLKNVAIINPATGGGNSISIDSCLLLNMGNVTIDGIYVLDSAETKKSANFFYAIDKATNIKITNIGTVECKIPYGYGLNMQDVVLEKVGGNQIEEKWNFTSSEGDNSPYQIATKYIHKDDTSARMFTLSAIYPENLPFTIEQQDTYIANIQGKVVDGSNIKVYPLLTTDTKMMQLYQKGSSVTLVKRDDEYYVLNTVGDIRIVDA